MKALKLVLLFLLISWGVFSAIYIFSTENSSPEVIVTPNDSVRTSVDTIATDPRIEIARDGYKALTTKGLDLTFTEIEDLNKFKNQNNELLRSCQDTDVKNFYAMVPEYYLFVDALKNNNLTLLNNIDGYKLSDVHKELLKKLKDNNRGYAYGEKLIRRILPVNSFKELKKKLTQSQTTSSKTKCQYCGDWVPNLNSHLKELSGKYSENPRCNRYYGKEHPHYYKCDYCNKAFDHPSELVKHKQESH